MGKPSFEPFFVRQSFSHARTEPVVVEKVKRRLAGPTGEKTAVRCPSCGAAMRVVRIAAEPGGVPRLATRCLECGGGAIRGDE
jgi:hypothetical protein